MKQPDTHLLYVDNLAQSAEFYGRLLEVTPVFVSPAFVRLDFDNGWHLALVSKQAVSPAATVAGGGSELIFTVADRDAVLALHRDWQLRGLEIILEPVAMPFGFTLVAQDADGHRLRVLAPTANQGTA